MGFRERIGLKPRASSVNLSSAMNNGLGVGIGGGQQQNMYSIPESGYAATPQQARQQQQPRTSGGLGNNLPFATRLGPGGGTSQTSFEGNRSASSGSAYSYTAGSTSTASFATTNTSNTSSTHSSYGLGNNGGGLGAGLRNFSGTSAKSNLSSKTAQANPVQQYQPKDPTITAADVRRCTKLLRKLFELHLELWTLTYTHETDQDLRHQKRLQVEAILVDIHNMVGAWHSMPPNTWTEEEHEEIKWIVSTLADLPLPPY